MTLDKDKKLTLDDVMCPICLDVFIEPVTLSCKHELCKECYDEHFQKADFSCPLCKKRLSTWARKAMLNGTLINIKKWEKIKEQYSELVASRANGRPNPAFLTTRSQDFRIAKPGELKEEYLKLKTEWVNQQTKEKMEEEEASLRLIEQIRLEEKAEFERKRKEQQEKDELLARQISENLEMEVSPSRINKVILRPRHLLSPISLNTQRSRRRKTSDLSSASTETVPNKRKRKRSMV